MLHSSTLHIRLLLLTMLYVSCGTVTLMVFLCVCGWLMGCDHRKKTHKGYGFTAMLYAKVEGTDHLLWSSQCSRRMIKKELTKEMLRYCGTARSFCSTSGTCHVNLVSNKVTSHEMREGRNCDHDKILCQPLHNSLTRVWYTKTI